MSANSQARPEQRIRPGSDTESTNALVWYPKPRLMVTFGVEYWATISLEIIEHKIGYGIEAEKVYYAIICCSVCQPHVSPVGV